jgi:dihydroorotase
VSTKEAIALIRAAKADAAKAGDHAGFSLTCEVTPHHITLTSAAAKALGAESYGTVNPPLRSSADRQAVIGAILDGTIDAIATDHAPHSETDKRTGAPGFSGLETAFSACLTELVLEGGISLSRLLSLMSAEPARIIGLHDRGRIAPGLRADFFIADTSVFQHVNPAAFKSKGKNSPFAGKELRGKIFMTIHNGRVVYEA